MIFVPRIKDAFIASSRYPPLPKKVLLSLYQFPSDANSSPSLITIYLAYSIIYRLNHKINYNIALYKSKEKRKTKLLNNRNGYVIKKKENMHFGHRPHLFNCHYIPNVLLPYTFHSPLALS